MTELSGVFDGITLGDASLAPYSAAEWAARTNLLHGIGASFPNYGIISGSGDGTYSPLQVQAKVVPSTQIEVEVGAALVAGYLYQNTAALSFTIGANASGNARIDTAILRVDFIGQTVRAVVKQGTPAASPVAPTLQQDAIFWEIPLAGVAVANGFSVINQTDIKNRQRTIHSISDGWQQAANPSGHYVAANYDLASIPVSQAQGALLVPFTLTANMLIEDVQVRHITGAITFILDWGIYIQDTNDGETAENTLRLVASGGGTAAIGGTTTIALPATPAPQVLKPGIVWLMLRWKGGTVAGVNVGAITGGNFDYFNSAVYGLAATWGTADPLPQTMNMVTSWTIANTALAIRLRGRVFGRTTV